MKNFEELLKEVEQNVKETSSKNGNVHHAFSKKDFNRLFAAYLNERDYKFDEISRRNGEYIKIEKAPVEEFYQFLGKQFKKAGLDTKDIELALDNIKFKSSECDFFHDLFTEFSYRYMKTGRRLKMFRREDVDASVRLKHVDEKEKVTKTGDGKVTTRLEAHYVLSQKSGTPDYLKKLVD